MGRNTGRPPYLIRGTIYVFASCLKVVSGTKCNVIEQKNLDLGLVRFSWRFVSTFAGSKSKNTAACTGT